MSGSDSGLEEIGCPDWIRQLPPVAVRAAQTVFKIGRLIELDRVEEDAPRALKAAAGRLCAEGLALAVPLPKGGALGGFLLAARANRERYRDSSLDALETLAGQSAVALENARAWEEVQILQRRLSEQNLYLKQELKEHHDFSEIVGESRRLREVLMRVRQVAGTAATVLITGETGTGRELIARAIHAESDRGEALMVKLACGAIPESLFESELFGHERGAFTGAHKRRLGRFEVAEGGTLFLDDVDVLPLAVQAKLLRAIQEGEVQRLGSNDVRVVDVRIIAATNKDLSGEVRAGRFREDLYYRLNVVPIEVPPLRDRPEDIPMLVQHFVAVEAAKHGRKVDGMSWSALEEMQRYAWPGNVRELRNVIERTVVLSQEPILRLLAPLEPERVGLESRSGEPGREGDEIVTLDDRVRDFKKGLIERTLAEVGGNHRRAAEKLGIHRPSLTRLVAKLGIRAVSDENSE